MNFVSVRQKFHVALFYPDNKIKISIRVNTCFHWKFSECKGRNTKILRFNLGNFHVGLSGKKDSLTAKKMQISIQNENLLGRILGVD